jgi:hypothetical protein
MIPAQRKELSRSRRRPPMIVDTSTPHRGCDDHTHETTPPIMLIRPVSNAAPGSAWRLFSNLT